MNRIAILNRKAATIQMSLRVRDLYRDLPTPSTILAGTSAQPSGLSFPSTVPRISWSTISLRSLVEACDPHRISFVMKTLSVCLGIPYDLP